MGEAAAQFDPALNPDDVGERSGLVAESPERAFFDPDNLPEISEIDLEPIRVHRGHRRDSGGAGTISLASSVRYLSEAANGSIDDAAFNSFYDKAADAVLKNTVSPEQFNSLYEMLLARNQRILELLQRVRREQNLTEQEFVELNRLSIYVSVLRTAEEDNPTDSES